jgi:ABC-2 type transport system ATP-binding protein
VNDAIELAGVTHRFAGTTAAALEDVSASIPSGRITGLVGPDGAGKTTLMRLMAGLLRQSAGSLRVGGVDPVAAGDELRSMLGYMPQKFGLYEDLTVQENLDLYADLRGVLGAERSASFARLLSFTDLAAFTDRPAGKLSGGMKQKLGLACVLLGRPQILLLDEPSVGVDPISRRDSGSTPTVGSSSSSNSGERTSVQARPSFCFIPPDNRPARRLLNGPSAVISISRAYWSLRSAASMPCKSA